jgi:hypothetical protein
MHPFVVPRGGARFATRCGRRVEAPLARVTAEYRETRANEETLWPALAAARGQPSMTRSHMRGAPRLFRRGRLGIYGSNLIRVT